MGCDTDTKPGVCYIICLQCRCCIDQLLPSDKQSDLQKKAAVEMVLAYLSPESLIPYRYHYINELIPLQASLISWCNPVVTDMSRSGCVQPMSLARAGERFHRTSQNLTFCPAFCHSSIYFSIYIQLDAIVENVYCL